MKWNVRFVFYLVIILLLCTRVPVYASHLIGDENGKAIGSTSVTARIELPEEENTDQPAQGDDVDTGDSARIVQYIILILLSGISAIAVLWNYRTKKRQENIKKREV